MTDDEKKAETLRLLKQAETEAQAMEQTANDLAKTARLVRDTTGPLARIYALVAPDQMQPGGWDAENANWGNWIFNAANTTRLMTSSSAMSAMSYGTVNSGLITASKFITYQTPTPPPIAQAVDNLTATLAKQGLEDKAIRLMTQLGIDRSIGGRRSPSELLREAKGALDRPVIEDSVTSVLIPLRESIEMVITELINRRQQQEEAKTWKAKVSSIGKHCGKSTLPTAHFEEQAEKTEALWKQLSGAKQNRIARSEVISLFHRGLLLINAILEGIDGNKLRQLRN